MALPESVRALFSPAQEEALLQLRRDLHRRPELAYRETETSTRLENELEALSPESINRVAGTGLVARIAGADRNAPTVAVRGDIDALPIAEETGLAYASENPGVMHACGHDVHATWTIGAAQLLAQAPANGDVLVVLQPAEETGEGAKAILETNVLDGVRAIFGGHVDRRFEVGQVVAQAGPLAASSDTFHIVLRGQGAHGARPHEARDPVVGLGALINALQTIVARRLNPAHPGVVSIGTLDGGAAPNVIPEEVRVSGTLRAVDAETRAQLAQELRNLTLGVAEAYGLTADIDVVRGTPPIVNRPEAVAWAQEAGRSLFGADAVVPLGFLNMGGEDFAFYLERMTGCFMRIGAREPGGDVIAAHSPRFYAADDSIFAGAAVLAETARRASAALASSNS